jgi:hypothetical protein
MNVVSLFVDLVKANDVRVVDFSKRTDFID